MISKGLVGLINLLFIFLTLHVYSKSIYSDFSYYLAISTAISSLCASWLTQSFLREKDFNFEDSYFIFAVALSLLLTSIVSIVASFFFALDYAIVLTLSSSLTLYFFVRVYFQKQRLIFEYFKFDIIRFLFLMLAVLLTSYFFHTFAPIIYSFFISIFISIFFARIKINIKIKINSVLFFERCKRWFKFGFPVALWLCLVSFYTFSDRYIIDKNLTKSELEDYTVLYDLILKFSSLIIIPISNAIYPILVRDQHKITSYSKLSFFTLIFCCIFSLVISTLIVIFINGYYDSTFLGGVIPMYFLVFGVIQWQMALIVQKPLELLNKTWVMFFNSLFCILFAILLNYSFSSLIGLPIFVYTLAASSMLYSINTFFLVLYFSRR
jgi:O-antigen/teichoic acid export membrane protein